MSSHAAATGSDLPAAGRPLKRGRGTDEAEQGSHAGKLRRGMSSRGGNVYAVGITDAPPPPASAASGLSRPRRRRRFDDIPYARLSVASAAVPAARVGASGAGAATTPRHKPAPFVHGNYDMYYGYRIGQGANGKWRDSQVWDDGRVAALRGKLRPGQHCLDVGCNAGYFTICAAEAFSCAAMLGVDLERQLIKKARVVLRDLTKQRKLASVVASAVASKTARSSVVPAPPAVSPTTGQPLPMSLAVCHGSKYHGSAPGGAAGVDMRQFPYNVRFRHEDFASAAPHDGGPYGIVFCLSVTKWVHLNNGDAGLRQFFRKLYSVLAPGGQLVLEPQPWRSYRKKAKRLTPAIAATFATLKLKPDQFPKLLVEDIGFESCTQIPVPQHASKGFRRPMFVLTKPQ